MPLLVLSGGQWPAAFVLQEALFHLRAESKPRQRAIRSYDPMTRNNERNWVRSVGIPDSSGTTLQRMGDLAIRAGLAKGNFRQGFPDLLLVGCPRWC